VGALWRKEQRGTRPSTRRRSTLAPLRIRNFRLFFAGQLTSSIGNWLTVVAQTFARSAKLSDKIKTLYLDFWELDEFPYVDTGNVDFQTNAPTGFYFPKSAAKPATEAKPAKKKSAMKSNGRKRRAA